MQVQLLLQELALFQQFQFLVLELVLTSYLFLYQSLYFGFWHFFLKIQQQVQLQQPFLYFFLPQFQIYLILIISAQILIDTIIITFEKIHYNMDVNNNNLGYICFQMQQYIILLKIQKLVISNQFRLNKRVLNFIITICIIWIQIGQEQFKYIQKYKISCNFIMKSKEHADITYLKNQQLSNILSNGFAEIFLKKPQFPVTYLANYLLSYSKQKSEQEKLESILATKRKIISDSKKKSEEQNKRRQQVLLKQKKILKQEQDFKLIIKNHQTHLKFLDDFCDRLEKQFNLKGVYIGQLKFPKRTIKPNQESETAHLEIDQPKRIQYIATSLSQKHIMNGKFLNADSITGSVFQQKQVEQQGQPEEGKVKQENKGYIYIPNVIKNDRITYFRYPKLGAYMCVPMIIKSYLNESLFQSGLQQIIKYNKSVQQLQKQREKKQNQFRELYEQKVKLDTDQKQLEEMERKFEQEKALVNDIPHPSLPAINLSYVICFDTLGLENQISEQDQRHLLNYVNYYKQCWESRQLSYLKSDIQLQIKYLQGFDLPINEYLVRLSEQEDKQILLEIEEINKQKLPEKEQNFEIQSLKLEKIKQKLLEEKYHSYFQVLLNMNILKYSSIIQSVLYFLGFQKEVINYPGTNILNWRQTKKIVKSLHLIEKLNEYNHRGLKSKTPLPYAKWNKILTNLQKYDVNAVLSYNLALGKILKYMLMTGKLRKLDVELRKQKLQNQRKIRQEKKIQNEKILNQKERVREQLRKAAQQKSEIFDQEIWQIQYNEEHPLLDIGEQIREQLDKDIDNQQNV